MFSAWKEKASNVDVANSFHNLAMVQERLEENLLIFQSEIKIAKIWYI